MRYDWALLALKKKGIDFRTTTNREEITLQCPHCDDYKFRLYFNLERGVYKCFNCDEGGGARPLLRKLGVILGDARVALYQRKKGEPKKVKPDWPEGAHDIKPGSRAFQYLDKKRGMTPGDLLHWQVKQGSGDYENFILFPILDMDGSMKGVHCRRFEMSGNRGLMYPPGIDRYLLGTHLLKHRDDWKSIVLVEGPYDAVHVTREMWSEGRISLALMGHSATPFQLLQLHAIGRHVQVMLDADALDKARVLARAVSRWVPSVEIIRLKSGDPDEQPFASLKSLLG